MNKDLSRFVWPVTGIACAALIVGGVYLGPRSHRPHATAGYGASAAAVTPEENGTTVYITRVDRCYHRAGCSCLSRSKMPIQLSSAEKRYRPCIRCRPPR